MTDYQRSIDALCTCRGYTPEEARSFLIHFTPEQLRSFPSVVKRERAEELVQATQIFWFEPPGTIAAFVNTLTEADLDQFIALGKAYPPHSGRSELSTFVRLKQTAKPAP